MSSFEDIRRSKLARLHELGVHPFNTPPPSPDIGDPERKLSEVLHDEWRMLEKGIDTETVVVVMGRITAIRNSGMFIDVTDERGKIQIFSRAPATPDWALQIIECLDLGDIISVEGIVRRTKAGELTIGTRKLSVLTKALTPLPDKHSGLHDPDTRQRQRYLDLIANEDTRRVLKQRSQIITSLRSLLHQMQFVEVETPMLHPIVGGATAKPFETYHNDLKMPLFLRVAPELYLKRLIVGGMEKIFEINRAFRNEGVSTRHNPEFTLLELYQAYATYWDMIRIVEHLLSSMAELMHGKAEITYGDHIISLAPPFAAVPMSDLVRDATGIIFEQLDQAGALQAARDVGCTLPDGTPWGASMEAVFGAKVEATLIQPTHVLYLPRDVSPLAGGHFDPRFTDRFETYVAGMELANAFSELTDPDHQEVIFCGQPGKMDEDFLEALKIGMPPTGGLGIGIDRLVMLLTNSSSIRDVIAFPTMRPL